MAASSRLDAADDAGQEFRCSESRVMAINCHFLKQVADRRMAPSDASPTSALPKSKSSSRAAGLRGVAERCAGKQRRGKGAVARRQRCAHSPRRPAARRAPSRRPTGRSVATGSCWCASQIEPTGQRERSSAAEGCATMRDAASASGSMPAMAAMSSGVAVGGVVGARPGHFEPRDVAEIGNRPRRLEAVDEGRKVVAVKEDQRRGRLASA